MMIHQSSFIFVLAIGVPYLFEMIKNKRLDVFTGDEGTVKTSSEADWKYNIEILATGDSRLSKGVIRAIPLHQILTAEAVQLKANKPQKWRFEIDVVSMK